MSGNFQPQPEDKFAFGLWTVMNPGRDPFGSETRKPLDPIKAIQGLARCGAYSFEFHDNDLVPFGATPKQRDRIVRQVKKVMKDEGIKASMATCNLFSHPVFKDGAFTANDQRVRALALQKAMHAIDLGAELKAPVFVFWGGREGCEVDASKDPGECLKRYRSAVNYLSNYVRGRRYKMVFAIEPKPNEPRGDIFLPTAGAALAFTYTCANHKMIGVNPEVEHVRMSGLNTYHEIGQILEAGKLFDIHLGAQKPLRFDQDIRFGAEDLKESFFVVKLLEDNKWPGTRAFDCHPYRTEDERGVWDFVRGNMRAYLVLKEKVAQYNQDPEIQALLEEIREDDARLARLTGRYDAAKARQLKATKFNANALARKRLRYEYLDQLLQELLLGVR